MLLRACEEAALLDLATRLRARFGDRVRELALFGSKARGDGDADSDLDVVVVIDGLTGGEGREIGHLAGDLLTEHDVLVSPFAVSTERMTELRGRERLIAAEIARDAVPF